MRGASRSSSMYGLTRFCLGVAGGEGVGGTELRGDRLEGVMAIKMRSIGRTDIG